MNKAFASLFFVIGFITVTDSKATLFHVSHLIKEGKEINYRKNNIISESEFNALPENKKFHFLEFCKLPGQMTDLDLKKVVIDLMERVEKLEAKILRK